MFDYTYTQVPYGAPVTFRTSREPRRKPPVENTGAAYYLATGRRCPSYRHGPAGPPAKPGATIASGDLQQKPTIEQTRAKCIPHGDPPFQPVEDGARRFVVLEYLFMVNISMMGGSGRKISVELPRH